MTHLPFIDATFRLAGIRHSRFAIDEKERNRVRLTCYASHFLRDVPDLFELARVLGHSHVRVTELYTHRLPGHLERARNAVDLP